MWALAGVARALTVDIAVPDTLRPLLERHLDAVDELADRDQLPRCGAVDLNVAQVLHPFALAEGRAGKDGDQLLVLAIDADLLPAEIARECGGDVGRQQIDDAFETLE